MKKNHGFTLVELLVIIAIMAIIASLLIPALYKSTSPLKPGVRVSTPDGKVGTIMDTEPFGKCKVRLLMQGPNGSEQYQEIEFMDSELTPVPAPLENPVPVMPR